MARKSKPKTPAAPATETAFQRYGVQSTTDNTDPQLPKDEEEEELEKLLFGDLDGFRTGLRAHEQDQESDEEEVRNDGIHGSHDAEKTKDLEALHDDQLFFIDTGPNDDVAPERLEGTRDNDDMVVEREELEAGGEQAAWEDSDDEKLVISLASHGRNRKLRDVEADDYVTGKEYSWRLRRQFERIYPVPDWALPPKSTKRRRRPSASSESSESEMDIDAETLSAPPLAALLQTSSTFSAPKKKGFKLRPEVIDIVRLTDANHAAQSVSGIQCLSFHPTHPLLLTSGFDSTIRIYHIDGKHNPLATSLHIHGAPLQTCLIHSSGDRIFAAGRRRYFHVWNLQSGTVERVTRIYGHSKEQKSMERFDISPTGRYVSFIGTKGTVQILDATTNQWIASANVEGQVADISWRSDGETLTIANTAGEVYEYSLPNRGSTSVWRDEGGVSITCVSNSPTDRFVAVGSASGVVNIYDRRISFGGKQPGAMGKETEPKPVRTVESLVTSISTLEFSKDGQVLCLASRAKKDALRLVHLPSCTVYQNWPTSATPLGRVSAVKWGGGRDGGWLAVGNEQGRVRLFEVRGS